MKAYKNLIAAILCVGLSIGAVILYIKVAKYVNVDAGNLSEDELNLYNKSDDENSKNLSETDSNKVEEDTQKKFTDNGLGTKSDNTIDSYTKSKDKNEEEVKEEAQTNKLVIEEASITDYKNAMFPSDYSYYHSDISDFGFGYPTKIYRSVSENNDETSIATYGLNKKSVIFEGTEGSRLVYSLTKRSDSLSLEEMTSKVYDTEMSFLFDAYEIVNSTVEDHGKVIVTGYGDDDRSNAVYCLSRIEEEYILQMRIVFPSYTDDEDRFRKDYMSECLYRMCTFSDANDGVRSYRDYITEKKEAVENMSADDTETERLRIKELIDDDKTICVKKDYGSGGMEWEQDYYFENGCLVFAYYYDSNEGYPNQRFYYKDGFMFRWCQGEGQEQIIYNISDDDMPDDWYIHESEVKEAARHQ